MRRAAGVLRTVHLTMPVQAANPCPTMKSSYAMRLANGLQHSRLPCVQLQIDAALFGCDWSAADTHLLRRAFIDVCDSRVRDRRQYRLMAHAVGAAADNVARTSAAQTPQPAMA